MPLLPPHRQGLWQAGSKTCRKKIRETLSPCHRLPHSRGLGGRGGGARRQRERRAAWTADRGPSGAQKCYPGAGLRTKGCLRVSSKPEQTCARWTGLGSCRHLLRGRLPGLVADPGTRATGSPWPQALGGSPGLRSPSPPAHSRGAARGAESRDSLLLVYKDSGPTTDTRLQQPDSAPTTLSQGHGRGERSQGEGCSAL